MLEPLKVSHYLANFGGNRQCCSGDTMVLIYHVILQGHVTKGSSNSLGRNPSR